MAVEVEIRSRLGELAADIPQRLIEAGYQHKATIQQLDIILDKPDGSLFKSGCKIRIRQEGDSVTLTYKGSLLDDAGVSKREEVEIDLKPSDIETTIKIFEAIGYPELFRLPKQRAKYIKGDIEAVIDSWPILGGILELEGPEEDILAAAQELVPEKELCNYRLKELAEQVVQESGKSFEELQTEAEASLGVKLGNLKLII